MIHHADIVTAVQTSVRFPEVWEGTLRDGRHFHLYMRYGWADLGLGATAEEAGHVGEGSMCLAVNRRGPLRGEFVDDGQRDAAFARLYRMATGGCPCQATAAPAPAAVQPPAGPIRHPLVAASERTSETVVEVWQGTLHDGRHFYLRFYKGYAELGVGHTQAQALRESYNTGIVVDPDDRRGLFANEAERDWVFARLFFLFTGACPCGMVMA